MPTTCEGLPLPPAEVPEFTHDRRGLAALGAWIVVTCLTAGCQIGTAYTVAGAMCKDLARRWGVDGEDKVPKGD